MKATFPIYPLVAIKEIEINEFHFPAKQISFATTVRKEYEGKYYLWDICRKYIFSFSEYEKGKTDFLKNMYAETYNIIILGKIDTSLIYNLEPWKNVFELDDDQTLEYDRLISLQPK